MAKQRTRIKLKTPSNIQEFIEFGWAKKMRSKIMSFRLRDSLNNPDDLENDIILSLMETDYIAKFDPERAAFSTYIYTFVDNFLKKRYNRETTKNGSKIVSAARLEVSSPDLNASWDGSTIYADLVTTNEDFTNKTIILEALGNISDEINSWTTSELAQILDALPAATKNTLSQLNGSDSRARLESCSECLFNGSDECGQCVYSSDQRTYEAPLQCKVFLLMLADRDSGDIANTLGVSRQAVNAIRNGIQQSEAYSSFKSYLAENPILNFHANKPKS